MIDVQRRTLLRRLAGTGAAAVGATGLASADRTTEIVWVADGTTERMTAAAFDRRSDTPALSALSDCCDCPDPEVCRCQKDECELTTA